MLPTRYLDESCMEALGIEASVRYLCHQLSWDEYADDIHMIYRNLILDFLDSLDYEPYVSNEDDRGRISFRMFGTDYSFTQKQFGDLLGFQVGPDVIPELPMKYFMNRDINKF